MLYRYKPLYSTSYAKWKIGATASFSENDTIINGITVEISLYNFIGPNARQIIEHRETSPNGQHELIAYRYINDEHNLSFVHISVIPTDGQIPKYGNYIIADMHSDYVLNGTWDKDNSLIFYSNNLYADLVQYYFVHNRPTIKYKVVNDDNTYSSKYRWTEQSSR